MLNRLHTEARIGERRRNAARARRGTAKPLPTPDPPEELLHRLDRRDHPPEGAPGGQLIVCGGRPFIPRKPFEFFDPTQITKNAIRASTYVSLNPKNRWPRLVLSGDGLARGTKTRLTASGFCWFTRIDYKNERSSHVVRSLRKSGL